MLANGAALGQINLHLWIIGDPVTFGDFKHFLDSADPYTPWRFGPIDDHLETVRSKLKLLGDFQEKLDTLNRREFRCGHDQEVVRQVQDGQIDLTERPSRIYDNSVALVLQVLDNGGDNISSERF